MNASVYIFGEFNSGYTQYPDDYTVSIFKRFATNAKSTTQIAIHRDNNLVYYGYIRKLEQDKYIGLCIVLNGVMLNRIDGLFSLFEDSISNLVTKGSPVHFDEQGNLVASAEKLYSKREEIDLIAEYLRVTTGRLENNCSPLPPVSYGTAKDSVQNFSVDDEQNDIIKSSYTNGYTYIYKSKDYNSPQLNSYQEILRKSHAEKENLKTQLNGMRTANAKLQEENARVNRQKKRTELVTALLIGIFFCILLLLFFNKKLSTTEDDLNKANNKITELNKSNIQLSSLNQELNDNIQKLKNENNTLNRDVFNLNVEKFSLKDEITALENKLALAPPLIITDVKFANTDNYGNIETDYGYKIYSRRSMFIKPRIKYNGLSSKEITLYYKIFNPDGILLTGDKSPSGYSYYSRISVVEGANKSKELSDWGNENKGHYWSAGTYRFEIWYESRCIWVGSYTIY